MTAEVREKIRDTFGKHYDADRFRQADREVSELLGEPHPQKDRSIVRKLKGPQEQSVVQTRSRKNEIELYAPQRTAGAPEGQGTRLLLHRCVGRKRQNTF